MARVTVEDCLEKVHNRFALVVLVIEISIYSLAHKVHLHLFYWIIMAFCLAYLKISKDEEAVPAVIKSTGP